ncbi:MAG: hypothetical protein QNK23_13885 [Crocinitomicaceae bacterium]|nr:hypothetical protein [Crocinitomicaceae bacterium]
MGLNNIYSKLFDYKIFHHYFLDDGIEVYDPISGPTTERLTENQKLYDLGDFLSIAPSAATQVKLKNWKAKFVLSKDGFSVFIKSLVTPNPGTPPPEFIRKPFLEFNESLDLFFDFIVKIEDRYFENYTDIDLNRERILFLSNQEPLPAEVVLAEDPYPITKDTTLPINYHHLTDFVGTPDPIDIDGSNINSAERQGIFAIIRIHLTDELDITHLYEIVSTNPDVIDLPTVVPAFELIFENRHTFWRYPTANRDILFIYEESNSPALLPLTKNGHLEIIGGSGQNTRSYPNPDAKLIIEEPTESGIFYSEVFMNEVT